MSTRVIRSGKVREPPIEGEWLRLSASVTAEIPPICGREDVIAQVRPSSSDPAPASFHIPTATITVDGNYLKDNYGHDIPPERVFPERYTNRPLYPALWGAITHEAAHAAFTLWPTLLPDSGKLPEGVKPHWVDVAILFEEPRIEHRQLQERGGDRRWLRACTKKIVMDEGGAPTTEGALAKAFILVWGRVIAGILDEDEAETVHALAVSTFGQDTVDEMETILAEVMTAGNDDLDLMVDLGRRWVELLGEDRDGAGGECMVLVVGEGEGDGDGKGRGEGSGGEGVPLPNEVAEAIAAAANAVADRDESEPDSDPAKEAKRRAEAAAAAAAAAESARVFRNSKVASHGYGSGRGGCIAGYRPPTSSERGGAALLARALRRAVIRERSVVTRTSQRPPGRLRMRDGVSLRASMAAGQVPLAEPFTRKVRKHSPSPPLRVGIAQDVSGSQSPFVGPAALAGWTVASAVSLIPEAQSAMVTFGSSVTPVVWPRQAPPGVPELRAADGFEMVSTAVRALDGALHLTRPGFARLLFLATDGEFVDPSQASAAVGDVARLIRSGCRVIWLVTGTGFSGRSRQNAVTQPGVVRVDVSDHPADIGKIIAEAVVGALKG